MSGVWNLGNHKRMREEEKNLYGEIRSFKRWAEKYYPDRDEENDNGEWEIGTDNHFDEMVDAALKVIENINSSDAGEDLIEALHVLYSIGSDKLAEYREKALVSPYKWLKANAEQMVCFAKQHK